MSIKCKVGANGKVPKNIKNKNGSQESEYLHRGSTVLLLNQLYIHWIWIWVCIKSPTLGDISPLNMPDVFSIKLHELFPGKSHNVPESDKNSWIRHFVRTEPTLNEFLLGPCPMLKFHQVFLEIHSLISNQQTNNRQG